MGRKISVIVPVYHSAPYLKFCVESVLRQTWPDFELLLISDGPTDGSEELCGVLSQRDRRIRFLPQVHKGVSAARNAGLEKAEGEYLFFLDSDDAIHPRFLERLMEAAERTGAAVTAGGVLELPTGRFEEEVTRLSASGGELPGDTFGHLSQREALDRLLIKPAREQMYAIGGKLVRASAASEVRFDEALTNGEDTKYMYQILAGGADAAILYEDGYYYRMRPGSLSRARTVEICGSLYECYRYICLRERTEGRERSALRWEEDILKNISLWHVDAHRNHDPALIQYTLALRDENRAFIQEGQMDWKTKLGYGLAFHCYPAYVFSYLFYRMWQRRRGPEGGFRRGSGA